MELYSYKRSEPKTLPEYIWLDASETESGLKEKRKCFGCDADTLVSYGFVGPIEVPEYDDQLQKLIWDDSEYKYNVVELTEDEIKFIENLNLSNEIREKLNNINYVDLISKINESKLYSKVSSLESENIDVKLLFYDVKIKSLENRMETSDVQNYITSLFLFVDFTEEDKSEIENILQSQNVDIFIKVPTSETIVDFVFDGKTNSPIKKSKFDSWILRDGKFVPPVDYPSDGKIYNWDESSTSWIELT